MAHVNIIHTDVSVTENKNKQGKAQIGINYAPHPLANFGLNLFVEVSTASALLNQRKGIVKNSLAVRGLVDTGATRTSIDSTLAKRLQLMSIGSSTSHTAAGSQCTDDYAIDLTFIGSRLQSILNLRVGSCTLNFDLEKSQKKPNDLTNIGLLIGRDVMSLWNVTWHGPTSTVFISD